MTRIGFLWIAPLVMVAMVAPAVSADAPEEGQFAIARADSDRIQKDLGTFRTLLDGVRQDLKPGAPEQVPAEASSPDSGTGDSDQDGEVGGDEESADPGSRLKAGYRDISDTLGHLSDTYRNAGIEAPYTDTLVQLSDEIGRHLDQFLNAPSPTAAKAQLKRIESILLTMEMTHKDHRRWLGAQSAVAGDGSEGTRAIVVGSAADEE